MPTPESEMKACAATPAADLEQQITDCRIPKNEREWWAHHEIARLKEALAAAHAKGIEEAAKLAEAWPTNRAGQIWREQIASAIRSRIKDQGNG